MCRLQSIGARFQPMDVELLGCFCGGDTVIAIIAMRDGSTLNVARVCVQKFRSCKKGGEGEERREGETERTQEDNLWKPRAQFADPA